MLYSQPRWNFFLDSLNLVYWLLSSVSRLTRSLNVLSNLMQKFHFFSSRSSVIPFVFILWIFIVPDCGFCCDSLIKGLQFLNLGIGMRITLHQLMVTLTFLTKCERRETVQEEQACKVLPRRETIRGQLIMTVSRVVAFLGARNKGILQIYRWWWGVVDATCI